MDWLKTLFMRLAPAASGALVTYGVTAEASEVIVLGAVTAIVTGIELWQKRGRAL